MRVVKFLLYGAFGFFALGAILVTLAGVAMEIPAPRTEVANKKPFADYIAREYRVVGNVSAVAWNDYPDKGKILSISLVSPPLARNRFVSYTRPLRSGQAVRIVSAWRAVTLSGFIYEYGVNLPGSELPGGVAVTMPVNADGVPDTRLYAPIER